MLAPVAEEQAGDEVTADHEEHVDAEEAAGHPLHVAVIEQHGNDRERPEAIERGDVPDSREARGNDAVRRLGSGHHTMVAREPLRASATREAGFTAAAGALARARSCVDFVLNGNFLPGRARVEARSSALLPSRSRYAFTGTVVVDAGARDSSPENARSDPEAEMGVLDGKVALITGASKGIGLGMATAYAREGAAVMLSSRKQEALDEAARGIDAVVPGAHLATFAANAGEPDQAEACVAATIDRLGGIDVLINNAATNPVMGRTIDADLDAWDKTFRVNVRGALVWSQLAWRATMEANGGCVINISSVGGIVGNVGNRHLQHHEGGGHPPHQGPGGRDGAAGAGQLPSPPAW